MIITKDFVILNYPKTGSTFVRVVIREIFWKRINKNLITKVLCKLKLKSVGYKEIRTPHPLMPNLTNQHGCYDQIPVKHNKKTILSVVRDPYAHFESTYKYKWWVRYPLLEKEKIDLHFPNFPSLTFQQFLNLRILLAEEVKKKFAIDSNIKIGYESFEFIRFFFKNHKKVLSELSADYIINGSYKKDMCDVTFIQNNNLNEELASFLSKRDFSDKEISFIRKHKKINVTKIDENLNPIDNEGLINYINEYEWILLKILSDLGFSYKKSYQN